MKCEQCAHRCKLGDAILDADRTGRYGCPVIDCGGLMQQEFVNGALWPYDGR